MLKAKASDVVAGALLLSASSIFVRMVGFVFRIYLSNRIGAQGMGLYTLIMSFYALGTTVALSGVSLAVSKLAAEELGRGSYAGARRVLRRALTLALLFGGLVLAVMWIFSDFIAIQILKDPRCALSLRILAPGMPMLAVSACFRGYFIACRNVVNTATGQVLEQLSKMALIVVLLGYWLPRGVEHACAAVVVGITFGELVCFIHTLIGYLPERRRLKNPKEKVPRGTGARILGIIVPVSLTSYARSGLRLMEDVLVLSGLKTFMAQSTLATETYGRVKGMVMPLLVFPLSLLSAFVITLTPEISRLDAGGERERMERVVSRILHVTCIIGIFIVGIFMTFSYELGVVFYRDGDVGDVLKQMAFLCPFMCVEMVVVSILQGLGQQNAVMRYSVTDCLLRVAMVYALVPKTGVSGFLWTVVASNIFTSALTLIKLLRLTKIKLKINDWILKPALAAASASQIVKAMCNLWFYRALPTWQALLLGLFAIGFCYVTVLFSVGSIAPEDFKWVASRLGSLTKKPEPQPEITGI